MSLCLYAVANRSARTAGIRGLRGEPLRVVKVARLGAIVGEVKRRPRPTLTNIVRYDRILTKLWEINTALLPARFGTVVQDASELELVMRPRADALRARLAHVAGCVQMTILLVDSRQRRRGAARQVLSGTEYLHAARTASLLPAFSPVRQAIQQWVHDERVQKRATIVSVDHLIRKAAVVRYRSAAQRAAREAGVPVRVIGPRAPYAFAGF